MTEKKITSYTSIEQNSIECSSIKEDDYGRIWYCNFDGYLHYIENEKLYSFDQKETIGYFKYAFINNQLYLVQNKKVRIYNLEDLSLSGELELESDIVYSTLQYKDKFYVVSGQNQIESYDIPINIGLNYPAPIIQKSHNGIILLSKYSDRYYLFNTGEFTENKLPKKNQFIQNADYIDGDLWVSTTNGIYRSIDATHLQSYFEGYNISSIYKDKSGLHWISTLNQGLILVKNFDSEFITLDSRPILLDTLSNHLLISADKDIIYKLSLEDRKISEFYKGSSNHAVTQLYIDSEKEKIYFTFSSFKIMDFNKNIEKDFQVAVKEVNKIDDKYFSFAASRISGIFPILNDGEGWYEKKGLYREDERIDGNIILKQINAKSTLYNPTNKSLYYATNIGLFKIKNNIQEEV